MKILAMANRNYIWLPGRSDAVLFWVWCSFWGRPLSGPPANARLECFWRALGSVYMQHLNNLSTYAGCAKRARMSLANR